MYRGHRIGALLLMAGSGSRFGSPKQFALLHDRPLYQHALQTLENSHLFDIICLVVPPNSSLSYPYIIVGGPTRQASSRLGIEHLQHCTDILLIHDAVRPFLTPRIIQDNLDTAIDLGAADTCIPSADTLVYAPDPSQILSIPPRAHYLRGQTPQTFRTPLILEAHTKTLQTNASDDCQLVLELNQKVGIVQGEERNLKVTTPQDLALAELLYETFTGSRTISSMKPGPIGALGST